MFSQTEHALAAPRRSDLAIVVLGVLAVSVAAWVYLLLGPHTNMTMPPAAGMAVSGGMAMTAPAWTAGYAALVFIMWAVMMTAMMLPSAAPTILLVAALARKPAGAGSLALGAGAAFLFASGYVFVWVIFSLFATASQWALSSIGMLSAMMAATNRLLAASLLIVTGIYQLTPLKDACLGRCRSPVSLLVAYWRPGHLGPVQSGLMYGLYCLGCCWLLMALLFIGGVMNFYWIAGLALLILVEKAFPRGDWMARAAGLAFVVWGVAALAAAL